MIDAQPSYLEIVQRVLDQHVPGVEARVFGSRVNSKAVKYSDLDLVLVSAESIPACRIESLKDAFAESDLPFQVDVLDWNSLSDDFRRVIEKKYEILGRG
jgi:predicted nucleotidyltransferase